MKLTILYPTYFPSLIWWQKAFAADVVIILDDQPNPRLGYINRCYLKSITGKAKMTVPVLKSETKNFVIKDQKIDNNQYWYRTHRASIISNYSNSPYFEFYFPYLQDFYNKSWHKLIDLNLESSKLVGKLLRKKLKFYFFSQTPTTGSREEKIINLLQRYNCRTYVIESDHQNYFDDKKLVEKKFFIEEIQPAGITYEQQFGDFISGLSILDLLFNEGPYTVEIINDTTELQSSRKKKT